MVESPKPITADTLHCHFVETYKLDDSQADTMVASAARSIMEVFARGEEALRAGDMEMLIGFAHNLKGLLLNMGQREWAEIASRLELAARGESIAACRDLVLHLQEGVRVLVLSYNKGGVT